MSLNLQTLPHPSDRSAIAAVVGDRMESLLSSRLLVLST
jgi:hypothetical protein